MIKLMSILALLALSAPVQSDEVVRGLLIQQEDGQFKGCTVDMGGYVACWQLYGPVEKCSLSVIEGNKRLVCGVET